MSIRDKTLTPNPKEGGGDNLANKQENVNKGILGKQVMEVNWEEDGKRVGRKGLEVEVVEYEKFFKAHSNESNFCDMLNWNSCLPIWEKITGMNRRVMYNSTIKPEAVNAVLNIYRETKGEPDDLWVDSKTGTMFSTSDNYFNWPHEFSFLNNKEDFQRNPLTGIHFVRSRYSYLFDRSFHSTTEFITDMPVNKREKYKGKRILVLGAGPSLKERIKDIDLNNYDYIWSCTKFYLSEEIKNINLDLFSIGGEVDLNNPDLKKYMEENKNCSYGIEGFVQPFKTKEQLEAFRDECGADRGFVFHTRYFSKLGAGPRLIAFATALGASQVSILGIDGHPLGQTHSFEENKKYKPNEAPTRDGAQDVYRRQFCILWAYLLSFPETEFINLGQGHPGNQSTDTFARNIKVKSMFSK